MGFFNKIFGVQNNNEKVQYFSGWEVSLDGSEQCENFMLTQCVDQQTALSSSSYIQLRFDENNLLKSGKLFSDGKEEKEGHLLENLQLKQAIGKLEFRDISANKVYNFHEDNNGLHQFGGDFPRDFKIPNNNLSVPFQYLGYLENKDQAFNWLPFRLNLICPIYLNIGKVFLDYSEPFSPTIVNREQVEKADCSYDELNSNSKIIFKELKFKTELSNEIVYGLGHTGVPNWIQYPDIPRCPNTNKTMKFVCQLRSDVGVEVRESNVEPSSDFMASYFKEMNFWGDGDLFVFFEPTSKVACYFIQNT